MSAPGLKITNFHYSNMKMPDPDMTANEYPKWVHMAGFADCIAQDHEHEAELLARVAPAEDVPIVAQYVAALLKSTAEPAATAPDAKPAIVLTAIPDERETLLALAKERGVKVDARWKTDRIRDTIYKEVPSK